MLRTVGKGQLLTIGDIVVHLNSRLLSVFIASLLAAAYCLGDSSTASAEDGGLSIQQVQAALGDAGVELPSEPLPVAADGSVDAGSLELSIEGVDDEPELRGYRQIWTDGTVEAAAQSTPTGVQVLSVFSSGEQTSIDYEFNGSDLELNDDGSVTVWPEDQAHLAEPVGFIRIPWALDASGSPVATYFSVDGERLTQTIVPTDSTEWPVVADPKIESHWWGKDIRFSKRETKIIAASSAACAVASVLIPDPSVSKAVAVGCGALAVYADTADKFGKCVALKDPKIGPTIPWIWDC